MPMIGNEAVARAFEQEFAGKIFRYVNFEDPVPLLPSISLVANTYAHCQTEVSLAAVAAVASALDMLKESAGSAMDRLIEASQIDYLWKIVQSRISAHFIDHYQERVKVKCGEGEVSLITTETTSTARPDANGESLEVNPRESRSDCS